MAGNTKRNIFRLTKAIFLGIITTIAISWASALLDDPKSGSLGWGNNNQYLEYGLIYTNVKYQSTTSIQLNGISADAKPDAVEDKDCMCIFAFGWPCFAMQYEFAGMQNPTFQKYTGILFTPTNNPGSTQIYALPFKPVWPGFIINTALYSVIWFTLITLINRDVRIYRTRFGKCPQCGYNLKDDLQSGCPECGWNRVETEKHKNGKTENCGVVQ